MVKHKYYLIIPVLIWLLLLWELLEGKVDRKNCPQLSKPRGS